MNCILIFHFLLLLISIVLLIFGISTPRWLVSIRTNEDGRIIEYSNGILAKCQQFHPHNDSDGGTQIQICFGYLSSSKFVLQIYQKALIGMSCSCVFVAVISLLLTQSLDIQSSFHKVHCSKRTVDYLLISNILTAMLAMITMMLFFGFEHVQTIYQCGHSFWSFVLGTCCIFLCCMLLAIFRFDVESEFHHYYHNYVATLC